MDLVIDWEGFDSYHVDYKQLAQNDADFAALYRTGAFDLQDPAAVRQLTKSTLKYKYGIILDLPDDRLCPPFPIRLSYIQFLTRLLSDTRPDYEPLRCDEPILGFDIGTGASLIYPLLATTAHPAWVMHGTDIDAHSLSFARKNRTSNPRLASRIAIHDTSPATGPLIPLDALSLPDIDFVMTNPPFYDSIHAINAAAAGKPHPPAAVCTGGEAEMITPGGDLGFARRMVVESQTLLTRVRWYTVMLGRLDSVHALLATLKEAGCGNWAVGVLAPGQRTRRWVVAWSWGDLRPGMGLVRPGDVTQDLWAPATERTLVLGDGVGDEGEWLMKVLRSVGLKFEWDDIRTTGIVEATKNTWSRAARRERARKKQSDLQDITNDVALAVRITADHGSLNFRWLRGNDSVLFESFYGMLKRQVPKAGLHAQP